MTVRKLWLLSAILAALLIGALILIFHYRGVIGELDDRPAFHLNDATMIERAYQLEAARNRLPVEQIKAQDYPVVVSFPDRRCVQLSMLRPPNIGGHSVYCFRDADGALVEQHRVGE